MTERILNGIEVLILALVLLSALVLQIFFGQQPCPLCYLQRLFMLGVGGSICLNLRAGIRKRHYGLAIIAALLGSVISLRQIALHACPDFSKFGEPFLGISLYTWAFLVFGVSIAVNALMMVIFNREDEYKLSWFDHTVFGLIFLAAAVNVVMVFMQCGIGPCSDV